MTLLEPDLAAGAIWWLEQRPAEDGRTVVVRAHLDGSGRSDAIPAGFSARTRVHEYGGGAYLVDDTALVFSNDDDGRLYRLEHGGQPGAITPEPAEPRALRYADGDLHPSGELTFWVHERHGDGEPVNEIVAVDALGDREPAVVATGSDFYAAPRVSPDGSRLAWLSWDHPRMPWDGTELWVAELAGDGTLAGEAERVAGGPEVSIACPQWSPTGVLHWISDESGWWNLYADGRPLHPADAEFAAPAWVFGQQPFAFLDSGLIACTWMRAGFSHIGLLDPVTGALEERRPTHRPDFAAPRIRTDGRLVAWAGGSPERPPAVVVVDPDASRLEVVARSTAEDPDRGYVATPEPIEFDSRGRTAHALFYPPRNRDFDGRPDERPPLLVQSHGGPTSQFDVEFDLATQFWTSRGFAIVLVNYGGSTGYGRRYRKLLRGQWGVVDVEDCTEAALHLARTGRVDGGRLAIRGRSAGGYTTLCALAFTDVFHAGASYYGVADVAALFGTTHKFESRYDEALIPAPAVAERSPINSVERISAPVIVFQGLDDPVVPPEQAELIVQALAQRGVDHDYHAYEGESHGFRRAETIADALESELRFYGRVFGFEPD
ncbi:MAG: S9 family peptidase [Thermoleophilaceae bacterium]